MAKGLMNGSVRMVLVNFGVNPKRIPNGIREQPAQTVRQFVTRVATVKGQQCLQQTDGVGCEQFLQDLAEAGYVLVDGFYQLRDQGSATVRFTFVSEDYDESSDEWKNGLKQAAEQALRQMVNQTAWQARAFLNPFFREREVVEGAFCASVNLGSRQVLAEGKTATKFLLIAEGDVCVKNA